MYYYGNVIQSVEVNLPQSLLPFVSHIKTQKIMFVSVHNLVIWTVALVEHTLLPVLSPLHQA